MENGVPEGRPVSTGLSDCLPIDSTYLFCWISLPGFVSFPVLKKLTASGSEGLVPPQAPARPPTTLPLATRNLLAAPWLLSLPLLFSWLGVPFHFLHSATRFFFLQNWVQMFPLPEAFLVFLAVLPRAPSELPSDSPITARSTQLSPPSFWPSQAASTGGNTKAPQGQSP